MERSRFLLGFVVLVTVALLMGLTFYFYLAGTRQSTPAVVVAPIPDIGSKDNSESFELGGLFVIGHWANTPVASTTALIAEHHFGGVIIMSAPENADEIRTWVNEWNSVSEKPLIIAIDQEGGPVSRLKGPDFIKTGQREIETIDEAYQVGLKRGQELSQLGINMNFAPVLDTAKNPESFMFERVFPGGSEAAPLATAMAKGMQEAGVIPVAKHFPGHDDTSDDSHFTLPTVSIKNDELPNFTRTFTDYLKAEPRAMMTAHVLFPEIDSYPATLSRFFLTDYLRNELGFAGVIVTDDMSMDAIDSQWSTPEATLMSLKAGADLILFAAEPDLAVGALERLESALENGEVSEAELAEKNIRVDTLRQPKE